MATRGDSLAVLGQGIDWALIVEPCTEVEQEANRLGGASTKGTEANIFVSDTSTCWASFHGNTYGSTSFFKQKNGFILEGLTMIFKN